MMNEVIDVKSLKLRKLLFGINLDELIDYFKEVVLTSMEPIEGASLSNTQSAEGHYKLLVKADKTLLEKVKDN